MDYNNIDMKKADKTNGIKKNNKVPTGFAIISGSSYKQQFQLKLKKTEHEFGSDEEAKVFAGRVRNEIWPILRKKVYLESDDWKFLGVIEREGNRVDLRVTVLLSLSAYQRREEMEPPAQRPKYELLPGHLNGPYACKQIDSKLWKYILEFL